MGYEYLCSAGETFDSVALAVYGDEKYAAELMAANGEYLQRMVFSGGERLALPETGTVLERTRGRHPGNEVIFWSWRDLETLCLVWRKAGPCCLKS